MGIFVGDNADNYKAEVFSNEAWVMFGFGGNDTLYGGYKADTIFGNDGDDVLFGYRGDDSLYGGTGNDSMVVDDRGDRAIELPGEGIDTVYVDAPIIAYSLSPGSEVENLILREAAGATSGFGNEFNNKISGNSYSNTLSGAEGDDTLDGGAGHDYLYGGTGVDSLSGGVGDDFYSVDTQNDLVVENVNEGRDVVVSSVSYSLENVANVERLILGEGSAAIIGTGNNDVNDELIGNSADNTLKGLKGSDFLAGWEGNDILIGTTGGVNLRETDTLDGGAGADTFVFGTLGENGTIFYQGEGYGLIRDFNANAGDKIELRGNFNNYRLERETLSGIGTDAQDTLIKYIGNNGNDLIGIIQDRTINNINFQNGFV